MASVVYPLGCLCLAIARAVTRYTHHRTTGVQRSPMYNLRSSYPLLLLSLASLLHAQDLRHVTEPQIPQTCTVLQANLAASDGHLPADAEDHLDTARIQQAMDHCPAGRAVVLKSSASGQVFLSGPLTLRSGVTLVVDKGTLLAASSNPHLYDLEPGSCGVLGPHGEGCKPFISGNGIANSGIMGQGAIDGRGGSLLLGESVTWWQLAQRAKLLDLYQKVPHLIILNWVKNFTLYGITLRNAPGGHVSAHNADGFTAWGVTIDTPATARNTDGIDPGSSTNVTIAHCNIQNGDDEVAVGSGGDIPSSHLSILDNHFYAGHGMSIGSGTSGGVNHMLVKNLTIDHTQNGIRIKSDPSRGGLVQQITYQNVCIRNATNPIVITPHYTDFSGDRLPIYQQITLRNVEVLTPGNYIFSGLDAQYPLGLTLDNVSALGLDQSRIQALDAAITIGPQRGNLLPQGQDVSITAAPGAVASNGSAEPLSCSAALVPFADPSTAPHLDEQAPAVDHTFYVAADGTGDFYSIQQAIDAVPETGGLISVAPGIYHEVLTVKKPHITLRSPYPQADRTVVVANKSAGDSGGTGHSSTVNILADDFTAQNITFQNDFNATHPELPQGSQAVALLVRGDREIFDNVRLLGNQDTLYAGTASCKDSSCPAARQYFNHCYIEGNVDFIFGDAKAVFNQCEIHSNQHPEGMLTAQSRVFPDQDSGYVFNDCKLTADRGVSNVYLGRPWRPYARVVYLNTWMGPQIMPAGWMEWHPGETHSLQTAYYAEFHSTGPGANPSRREPYSHQLTPDQAAQFAPENWLRGSDGWDPAAALSKQP